MQEKILEEEPSEDVRFYVVWLNQRVTDERGAIDESILADPRVTQYWDAEGITGTYFADADLGELGASGLHLRRLLRLRRRRGVAGRAGAARGRAPCR